jgi:hypothetical protein
LAEQIITLPLTELELTLRAENMSFLTNSTYFSATQATHPLLIIIIDDFEAAGRW